MASDGHMAHSGMAKAPMQVQVFGESGRRLIDSGLSDPNHSIVLDISLYPHFAKLNALPALGMTRSAGFTVRYVLRLRDLVFESYFSSARAMPSRM
jgi:hypothetical protein